MAKILLEGEGQSSVSDEQLKNFYQEFRDAMHTKEDIQIQNGTETVTTSIQTGVRETLGENPKLKSGDEEIIKSIVSFWNPGEKKGNYFSIKENSSDFGTKDGIPLDLDFVKACQARAETNGDIVIMCGVNVDSLGDKGVLEHPDKYAPKPMSCHAKSSYFGFTKGLVPSNPEFSRQNIAADENALESAKKDVAHSRKNGGVDYHLKLSIGDKEYYIYQGKFKIGNEEYRYQVALQDGNASEDTVKETVLDNIKKVIQLFLSMQKIQTVS